MNHDFSMFIVDDAPAARFMLEATFKHECQLESFATAEACLARLATSHPDIFLLDVDLPGMDGYSLCRKIKAAPELENIPVIFISGLDDLESRMDGYDAGGSDYVVKPYNMAELKQKIAALRRQNNARLSLVQKIQDSRFFTSQIITNMDEYAALINFLRSLNDCDDHPALLALLFNLMRSYELDAVIQLRIAGVEITLNKQGESRPLELAVMNNMRTMERIVEFKSRAAYNFTHITILINNTPLHNPELCGRLRDHLAIAAETANAKLLSLQTREAHTQVTGVAAQLLVGLQKDVQDFEQKYAKARQLGNTLTQALLHELSNSFITLGLSDNHEKRIENIVQSMTRELTELYDFGGDTQKTLNDIAGRISSILDAQRIEQQSASVPARAAIELF